MHYLEKYNLWLKDPYFDEKAKAELRALDGNEEEIRDRFYKDLQYRTADLCRNDL